MGPGRSSEWMVGQFCVSGSAQLSGNLASTWPWNGCAQLRFRQEFKGLLQSSEAIKFRTCSSLWWACLIFFFNLFRSLGSYWSLFREHPPSLLPTENYKGNGPGNRPHSMSETRGSVSQAKLPQWDSVAATSLISQLLPSVSPFSRAESGFQRTFPPLRGTPY